MTYLDCSSNQLTALPDTLPSGLTTLDCSSNQLTALPATLPSGLTTLDCGGNQLTESAIDGVISQCLANAIANNLTSGTLNIADGYATSNAPSDVGIANAATLANDYGWTVQYNQPTPLNRGFEVVPSDGSASASGFYRSDDQMVASSEGAYISNGALLDGWPFSDFPTTEGTTIITTTYNGEIYAKLGA